MNPNIEAIIESNIQHNIQPNIQLNIYPNIECNICPIFYRILKHIIEPKVSQILTPILKTNIKTQYWTQYWILIGTRKEILRPQNLHTVAVCVAVRNFFLTRFLLNQIVLIPKNFWIKFSFTYIFGKHFFVTKIFWIQNLLT